MSLDVMKTITEAEQAAQTAKEETAARCKTIVREAKEAGAGILEQARGRAAEEAKALNAQAEAEGKAAAVEMAEKLQNQKVVIRTSSEQKMQEAAAYIAGKIMET